jgi:hypothetical protein
VGLFSKELGFIVMIILKGNLRTKMATLRAIVWFFLLALCQAWEECQIEGRYGWASKLPCWRIRNKLITFIIGKELTGYHVAMLLMFGLIFHSIFIFKPWTLGAELIVLALLTLYFVVEDFLFFVLNPYFGIKKFKARYIPWHKNWIKGLPVCYWVGLSLSVVLLTLGLLL